MNTPPFPGKRTFGPQVFLWLLVALALILGVIAGASSRAFDEAQPRPWQLGLFIAFGSAVLVTALVATLAYWRRLDEAAREAHKWAWYWGGSLGMLPGLLLPFTGRLGPDVAERLGFVEAHELMHFGAMAVLTSMIAGYTVAWLVWWLRKR